MNRSRRVLPKLRQHSRARFHRFARQRRIGIAGKGKPGWNAAARQEAAIGMKRLLVMGHGYLGRAVVARFRADGWHVAAASLGGGDGAVACDVGDAAAVGRLVEVAARPDVIIHCAASGHGGADAYQRVYVDGCTHLRRVFPEARLVFVSSTSVYGQTDGSTVDENSPAEPQRATGRLLLEAEGIALAGGGTVCRLAGIYGPGRSVILQKFLTGRAVVEEDGRRFLNQIHRDDAVRALAHVVVGAGELRGVFNVCDSRPLSQLECYQRLCELFDRPLPPSAPRDLNRKRGWTHKRVSNAKLLATGWQPEFPCFLDAAASVASTLTA